MTCYLHGFPQGRFSGLCGNFDSVTVNDMTTSSHMEVNNAQTFGDSWALGQVWLSSPCIDPNSSSFLLFIFVCLTLMYLSPLSRLWYLRVIRHLITFSLCVCMCAHTLLVFQCESDYIVERPCEGDLGRQPYAKRECALLYSDVFAPCHNVVSAT